MRYANIFSFDIKWDCRTTSLFILLIALPNLLGLANISTQWGFKIHFFQYAIFVAALIYGPIGGMLSGAVGSIYSASIMHNPYIVVGNAILGFFFGLFARYGLNVILSVLLAYLTQLPWLVVTDIYFMHLSVPFVRALIIALAISNLIWATFAHFTVKPIKSALHC